MLTSRGLFVNYGMDWSMSYALLALLAVLLFSAVHLYAGRLLAVNKKFHSLFLSFGGGVAIAYMFIDLLPKLAINDLLLKKSFSSLFPYFERHVYVMALFGFLLFFLVEKGDKKRSYSFTLSLAAYAFFNFLVGYAVVDPNDPEVQPLLLFTFAMGLHYFTNDFTLSERHGKEYMHYGRWILVMALFIGYIVGLLTAIPATAVALMSAFIGGGVIMNVIRHELPTRGGKNVVVFTCSALFYTIILLTF